MGLERTVLPTSWGRIGPECLNLTVPASALSLLSNAVLVFNTVQFADIVRRLQKTGGDVEPHEMKRISPLAHAHVIPNGTYHFDNPSRTGPKGENNRLQ